MRNKILILLFLFSNTVKGQTLYVADSMESPGAWRGTSSLINSSYIGGLSTAIDNPPNYTMYSSFDTCYVVKGIGLGSSTIEGDTLLYPNLPINNTRRYEVRFKVASFGLPAGGAAGVDAGDTLMFDYRIGGSPWLKDIRIIGNNNSCWTFDGAIGTNTKLNIVRNGGTIPNVYISYSTNPITNVTVKLQSGTYTTIQIRFITYLNGSGETWMIDDVEVWDVTPSLPVELVEFGGKLKNNIVHLNWETCSEINNDRFEIYKSYDAITYDVIGTVSGNGTTNQIMNYEFYDYDHCDNIVYYKLRQVDYDGIYKEYDPIAINCQSNRKKLFKIVNALGQEVNENYEGLKFYIYE